MAYKSENIEKIKKLSDKISSEEITVEKKEIVNCLEKIFNLLDSPRTNKKAVQEEVRSLIAKIA